MRVKHTMRRLDATRMHRLPRELAFAIRQHVTERVHLQRRLHGAARSAVCQHTTTAAGTSGGAGGRGTSVRRLPRELAFAGPEHVAERVHVQRRVRRASRRAVRFGGDGGGADEHASARHRREMRSGDKSANYCGFTRGSRV